MCFFNVLFCFVFNVFLVLVLVCAVYCVLCAVVVFLLFFCVCCCGSVWAADVWPLACVFVWGRLSSGWLWLWWLLCGACRYAGLSLLLRVVAWFFEASVSARWDLNGYVLCRVVYLLPNETVRVEQTRVVAALRQGSRPELPNRSNGYSPAKISAND